ncbi:MULTISPECIES: HlyD family type I secretion periplasmic adaptor subunit [Rhodomicrobium]|uniref:HlyD family type I secretion periplasmic adaptor subunit n=1 Tax=Rhodomicrobium TaxID=1068 RepID=UPI001AECF64B|nr:MULTISPECIES: HlyD family type I secretion periplasmic adaptor subunit [Rhodomicrobium]
MKAPNKRPTIPPQVTVKTNARPWILFGMFWIVLIFVGFGSWAATASLSSAVIAQGTIMVDSKRKTLQHLEGGIVEQLMVRDGDVVNAGDVLVKLDPVRSRSMLAIVSSSLVKELAGEARLIAERDGSQTITYPAELTGDNETPETRLVIASQNAIFEARRASLQGEIAILEQRVSQLDEQISGMKSQRASKQRQMEFIEEELKGLRQLMSLGQTTKPRILALERSAAALQGEEGELLSNIARTGTAVGETKLQIIQRQQEFQKTVTEELETTQSKLRDLQERAVAARDVLKRINITAPVGGTVVNMVAHTVGAVIKPGETILEIVPDKDSLIAEVIIRPQDIDNVTLDQTAAVRLLAFKQRTTPLLHGAVSYVSADALENPATRQQYFLARIEVPDDEIAKLGKLKLTPGMQVEVMIRTGDRTAFQYLVQPMVDSFNRAWREE